MISIEEAIQLVEMGEVEKGVEEIKLILGQSDDHTKFNMIELFQQWGMVQEAIHFSKELLQKYPGDSQIILLLAELYIDLDQEEEAIQLLRDIDQSDESFLSAQLLLADLYQLQGLDEVAEQKLLAARKIAPQEPILTFALGEFYLSIGQASKALPLYQAVLHEDVLNHENIALKLAEAYSLVGQFEEALPLYKEGLEKGKSLDALFGYAMTAYQLEEYSTVISALGELKELDAYYTTLYPILAKAYIEMGAIDEGIQVYQEGIKVDEHNDRLYLDASVILFQQGNSEQAVEYILRLLKIDSDNLEALRMLVDHYDKQSEYEKIIDLLKDAQHDDPNLTWALANAYLEEDHLDSALKLYQDAYTNLQTNPTFLQQFGDCALQLGDHEQATKLFREAIHLDPLNNDLAAFVERLELGE